MFKKISLFVGLCIALSSLFTACNKEEDKTQSISNPQLSDLQSIPDSSKCVLYHTFQKSKNSLKGLLALEDWIYTNDSVFEVGTTTRYKAMKVYRRNSKKWFFIMIENLRYKPANSGEFWAYNNDEKNVPTYGRLYDWQTASNLGSTVFMKLPKFINGVAVRGGIPITTYGRLPKIEDIRDLLETSNVGHLPTNGINLDSTTTKSEWYYDVFLAGKEDNSLNPSAAYHSLAGGLDNPATGRAYDCINRRGWYWLSEEAEISGNEFHYCLEIMRSSLYDNGDPKQEKIYNYSAYINAARINCLGFSVRYIFDPFQ